MAKYRVTAISWIGGRTVQPGEVIEYAGVPGSKLIPVDDEAEAAKEDAKRSRLPLGGRAAALLPVKVNPEKPERVEVPEGWEDLRPEARINLARRLGAPAKGTGTKQADEFIKAEIVNRAVV